MKVPEYTPRLRRRLTLALLPLRMAGCALAAWGIWLEMERVTRAAEIDGPAAEQAAFSLVTGLLAGIVIAGLAVGAVFIWYPLPPAERRPTRR